MGASSQSTDFQIFRFGERPIGDIEAALRQVGMFAPKRAIWLRAFAEGKRKQAADTDDDETDDNEEGEESAGGPAALLALLEGGIPRETLFVISAPALDARLLADGEPPLRLSALLASHVARLADARPIVDSLPRGWLGMKGAEFLSGPGASLPDSLRGWPGYFRLRAAANFSSDELRRL